MYVKNNGFETLENAGFNPEKQQYVLSFLDEKEESFSLINCPDVDEAMYHVYCLIRSVENQFGLKFDDQMHYLDVIARQDDNSYTINSDLIN